MARGRSRGSIRERSPGSFEVTVPLPAGPNGERRRQIVTVRGSRRDAERERTRLLRETDTQQRSDASKLTLGEYLERWLRDYAELNLSPQTVRGYRRTVSVYIEPAMGKRHLERLTPMDIQRYYTERLTQTGAKGRPLSPTTVLQHHHILRRALEHAVRWRLLAVNPAAGVEPPRKRKQEMAALTPDQALRLLAAARAYRLYVPIALALLAGLRRGEIFALRWMDVEFDSGLLHVRRSLDYTTGVPVFREPKSARSRRPVVMPPVLVSILRQHQQEQVGQKLYAGEAYQDHGLVCCLEDGRPVCHAVNAGMDRILEGRTCPECGQRRVHQNRHAAGWVWVARFPFTKAHLTRIWLFTMTGAIGPVVACVRISAYPSAAVTALLLG